MSLEYEHKLYLSKLLGEFSRPQVLLLHYLDRWLSYYEHHGYQDKNSKYHYVEDGIDWVHASVNDILKNIREEHPGAQLKQLNEKTLRTAINDLKGNAKDGCIFVRNNPRNKSDRIFLIRLNIPFFETMKPHILSFGHFARGNAARGKNTQRGPGEMSASYKEYSSSYSSLSSSFPLTTPKPKKTKSVKVTSKQAIPLALDELTPEDVMIKLAESECHPTNHIRLFESFLAYKKKKNATPKPLAAWQAEIKRYCKKGNEELDMGWKNPQTQQHLSSVPDAEATKAQLELEKEDAA